ncbi:MAG TPA: 50S ribosomal protein L25/general stress protein Ctc [Longimicrobiales bacterium]|nr:50S ribosomal protein L25/general stress protein Ctc [Longimicrobiales bacterium]
MAKKATLKAEPRSERGKGAARKTRAAGRIPAVVYGHGEPTRELTVDAHELELLFARVHYENTIINLDIAGEKAEVKVLVREVQSHAFRPDVLHVDFYQIHAGEKLVVDVPIRLQGTAAGVRAGGVMMQTITDLEVRCLPDHIPEFITIDVSGLEIADAVHVGDLTLPEGVEPQVDADRVVCSVTPPTVSVAETEAEEAEAEIEAETAASSEPEVIRRGKEQDEE